MLPESVLHSVTPYPTSTFTAQSPASATTCKRKTQQTLIFSNKPKSFCILISGHINIDNLIHARYVLKYLISLAATST